LIVTAITHNQHVSQRRWNVYINIQMASAGHGDAVTMAKKMLAKQKNKLRVVK
jgi:hypothetical protein